MTEVEALKNLNDLRHHTIKFIITEQFLDHWCV